ncbi:hypothetical protein [Kordia sp. SMS9]|uniref:hypothetical protein n=1 Tax=Kordia sp. SMS9 TaxID=2282170 RepID=UPI0013B46838|nr:hypothetical protein [Kordia sp. SMS9]
MSKKDQKHIKGSDSFMCLVMCEPNDANTPIYNYGYYDAMDAIKDVKFGENSS